MVCIPLQPRKALNFQPDFVRQMGGSQNASGTWELSADTQSVITSLLSAGTFFGAILQTFTSDRLGRKGSIMFWSVIVRFAIFTLE